MLTRSAALIASVWAASLLLSGVAAADPTPPPPIVVTGDNHDGSIDTTVTAPAAPGASKAPGSSSSSDGGNGVTCTWTEETQYSQDYLNWLGGTDGTWYDVRCSDGSVTIGLFVPAGSGNVPPAVVLAGVLARTAANRLQLPQPRVGHSPNGQTLVGLPTWFWVDPAQWQVLRQRTTAGPVWAQVTATPVSTTWDPGDGSPALRCVGPGTAYDRSRPEAGQSTDCSYVYRRSSAEQPQTGPDVNDRYFTVTVTTTWQVSWAGPGGSGGTLPALTRSYSFPLAVAQRQTVVTGGSG